MQRTLSSYDSLVKKASYLRILAKNLADEMKSGNFRSLYRGQGVEFLGVRDYIRGDDVRAIDWNVTARMGRPYIKMFEEEKELCLFVVLDASLSMQTNLFKRTKLSSAAEAAALLILAAEMSGCPVGAVFFDNEIYFSCKPYSGREQTMLLLTHLDRKRTEVKGGSVLSNALNGAGKLLKKRSLVFVISDFRSGDWEKPLISLSLKNDVIALRVQDENDGRLFSMGTVPFKDAESEVTMTLPSSSEKFQKEWKQQNDNRIRKWTEICSRHSIQTHILNTSDEPLEVLGRIFSQNKGGR